MFFCFGLTETDLNFMTDLKNVFKGVFFFRWKLKVEKPI